MLLVLFACATGAPPLEDAATPSPATSRLARETSPYLLDHAKDLVDWYPWGTEAFAAARARDVPVLLVVGYASCHWCHVMAEESFRDAEIGRFIDAHFVAVAVDREERPDVDAAEMRAVQALTGKPLGWPLVVLLSPEGEVLFGTTYLPARDGDRGVSTGFLTVLTDLSERWTTDRASLLERGRALARDLSNDGPPGGPLGPDVGREMHRRLGEMADRTNGGFGTRPKFPRPTTLDAWLAWGTAHGVADARDHVLFTLRTISTSALHDPIDGGFHRYAVDAAWRVPHYEKSLTDNAQLGRTALDAWRATGEPGFADTARDLVRFLGTLWVDGGLAGGIDADSLGADGRRAEGAYYLLRRVDALVAFGDEGPAVADALGLVDDTPSAPRTVSPLTPAQRARLPELRAGRAPPQRDEKVVTAWQGEAIAFLARAGRELPDAAAAALALRLGRATAGRMTTGPPGRTADGTAPATLDDLAFLADGYVELFLATNDPAWLDGAERLVAFADAAFRRPDGGWWRTAVTEPPLPFRPTADEDGPEPAAAPVLARVRLRLARLRGDEAATNGVREDLLATSGAVRARPASHTAWLRVNEELSKPPPDLVLVWPDGVPAEALRDALFGAYTPGALELALPASRVADLATAVPLLADRDAVDVPTVFVCTRGVCQAPATTVAAFHAALAAALGR